MLGYEFVKEPKMKEEWVMVKGESKIPLEAFSSILRALGIAVIIYLTYNMAQFNASELIKWMAYFHGIENPDGTFTECWPFANGTAVSWNCEETNKTRQIEINGIRTNFTIPN